LKIKSFILSVLLVVAFIIGCAAGYALRGRGEQKANRSRADFVVQSNEGTLIFSSNDLRGWSYGGFLGAERLKELIFKEFVKGFDTEPHNFRVTGYESIYGYRERDSKPILGFFAAPFAGMSCMEADACAENRKKQQLVIYASLPSLEFCPLNMSYEEAREKIYQDAAALVAARLAHYAKTVPYQDKERANQGTR
jgi:hypothetical protein